MKEYHKVFIDFEFSGTNKRWLDLICCVMNGERYDLTKEEDQQDLKDHLRGLAIAYDLVLVSYNVEAELRAFMSLYRTEDITAIYGPIFKHIICLHTEHKFLANKDTSISHGDVILKGRKVRRSILEKDNKKVLNLENAIWKFLKIYTPEFKKDKDYYRDICIQNDPERVRKQMPFILDYCAMDCKYLPKLYNEMVTDFTAATMRGEYVAFVAEQVQRGYYINRGQLENLRKNTPKVMSDIIRHILKQWPDLKTFSKDKKTGYWVFHDSVVLQYIMDNLPIETQMRLPRTKETKKISISKETFEKLYGSKARHTLKDDDYLQQIYKYKDTLSSLGGIVRKKTKTGQTKPLSEYLDPKEPIVRPYLNPYGGTTGRNQPSTNSFLLGKPAWMRVLLTPPPGNEWYMISIDCGKQEYLYLAVASGCKGMLESYASGDPHADFGLRIGLLDESMRGTPEWAEKRHIAKTTVFMILYEATGKGLSDIVNNTGGKMSPDEGDILINKFYMEYPEARTYKNKALAKYRMERSLELAPDWTMWGNNYNERSIKNSRIQGGCAWAYRLAIKKMRRKGIVCPLGQHDSFTSYCCGSTNLKRYIRLMCSSIQEAFSEALDYKEGHDLMTLDTKVIGNKKIDFSEITVDERKFPVKFSYKYEDERATKDLRRFRKYLQE